MIFRKIKQWIIKIQGKAIIGVCAKDCCLKEELIFPEEKFVMPAFKDVLGKQHKDFVGLEATILPFYVRSFKDGICFTDREEIFVSPYQVVLEYTAQKINPVIGTRFLKQLKIKKIKGAAVHLSLSGLENNYYHWLVECLGRLYLIEKSGFKPDYYIVATKLPFQKEFLELLGIDHNRIIPAESKQLVQMEELIVPTFLNNWEFVNYRGYKYWQKQYLPRWVGDIYKDRILPNIKKTQKKRIYITRKDARYRKVINEKDVIGVLNSYGFEMVNLDKMKVIDQIGLFANAEVVVSIFGAGLTNMLFCPSQTRLLVIYPEYFHDAAYRILASTLDVSYYYLVGKTPDVSVPPQQEDVLVNINEFRESLDRLLR